MTEPTGGERVALSPFLQNHRYVANTNVCPSIFRGEAVPRRAGSSHAG